MPLLCADPIASIDSVRWHRLDLGLRNLRDRAATKHPLLIFEGLLKTAAPAALKPANAPRQFFFHPVEPVGARIECGMSYRLRVVFPTASVRLVKEFADALTVLLANPANNFALLELALLPDRSLADLVRENPLPEGDEVCLDFITPLEYSPRDHARKWLFTAEELGRTLTGHLGRTLGVELAAGQPAFAALRTLPWFWRYERFDYESKSSRKQVLLHGNAGPLFLRGNLAPVWPLLLLGSEFHAEARHGCQGAYALNPSRPVFTSALQDPETYLKTVSDWLNDDDPPEDAIPLLAQPDGISRSLADAVLAGNFAPDPALASFVPMGADAECPLAQLSVRDQVLHKAILRLITPACDRMLAEQAVGYRPDRTREQLLEPVRAAYRAGRVWFLRADIESFFDEVDWDLLETKLAERFPRADTLLRGLLRSLIRTPVSEAGAPRQRRRGLLQGSPLSPLLSNLFLTDFDQALGRHGLLHVRFADDLLVPCSNQAEAESARAIISAELARLGLRLNGEKTAILPADHGVTWLGQTIGGGLDPLHVAEAATTRHLFVRDFAAWAGVDGDALAVRVRGELVARVPLRRLDGVTLMGAGGLSVKLVEKLRTFNVPLTFASPTGRPINTLLPPRREHWDTIAAHSARFAALREPERLDCARRLVHAKLTNCLAWLPERSGEPARATEHTLDACVARLPGAATVDELLGHEGVAARAMFRFMNNTAGPLWFSPARVSHARHDPWNSLLDLASHLLFTRLLILCRHHGLHPWLGFLHSPANRYESLVCDLQEPFRPRLERFVLRLTAWRVLQPTDFMPHPEGGVRLTPTATAAFLEQWERELLTTYRGEPVHGLHLLTAQVLSMRDWVRAGGPLRVHHAQARDPSHRPEPPPPRTDETQA